MVIIIVCVILFHFMCGFLYLKHAEKDGIMEFAVKYGDGFRWAKPSDIVFRCIFIWEIPFIIEICEWISTNVNEYYKKKYEQKGAYDE